MRNWPDGLIKQHIHAALLRDRSEFPTLYAEGDYQPLTIEGAGSSQVIGYIRRHRTDALAVIVPRLWAGHLGRADSPVFDASHWQDMSVALPHGEWLNVIAGEKILIDGDRNRLSDFMGTIPFAVLRLAGNEGAPG